METMLELYDINEIIYCKFPLYFNLIDRYHQKEALPTEKN